MGSRHVPFPMVTLCARVTQVVCKIRWYLTCNNEQTRVNSWHSFGIKHRNKITASEFLNYSSQISVQLSCENLQSGEIIAIFSYCQHLRISVYTWRHTHKHAHTHAHVRTQVNLKTNQLCFPETQWQMKEWLNTVSLKQGHITKKDHNIPFRHSAAIFQFQTLEFFPSSETSHQSLLHYVWCHHFISWLLWFCQHAIRPTC